MKSLLYLSFSILLALKGCIVTIDAVGIRTKIAKAIRYREADHLLCERKSELSTPGYLLVFWI